MTSSKKWLVVLALLLAAIVFGNLIPFMWYVFWLAVIIVLLIPGKHSADERVVLQNEQQFASAREMIIQKIAETRDERYRAGLQDALDAFAGTTVGVAASTQFANVNMQYMTAAQQPIVVQQPVSEIDVLANKEKQDQQNTNTILYVASFLLVGAAVLFIGTNLDPFAKFLGILFITALFYVAGISLYKTMERLRPAAIAFTGTGLALVPFVGLAMYSYVLQDASMVWFMTSVAGLVLYLYATVVIKHQVLAYLSSAFIFSLTTSYISVISVPFVWYFVTVILTGALLGYVAYKRPAWLPQYLHQPFEQNGLLATPLAVVGSILAGNRLSLADYELIAGVTTLYYLVMSLGLSSARKLAYWGIARMGFIILLLLATYDITADYTAVALTLAITAVASAVYSAYHKSRQYELYWIIYSQVALAIATFMWLGDWVNVSIGLAALAIASIGQLVVMKREPYALGFILALILLPFTTIMGIAQYEHSSQAIVLTVLFASVCIAIVRYGLSSYHASWRHAASVSYLVILAEALITVLVTNDMGWIASVYAVSAGLLFVVSFMEKMPNIHVASNIVGVVAVWCAVDYFDYSADWRSLIVAVLTGGLFYGLSLYYENSDTVRRQIMFGSSLAVLLFGATISSAVSSTTVAACLVGCVVAALVAYEGFKTKNLSYYDLAIIIATIALQRMVSFTYEGVNTLIYTHWWAASIGLMGYIRLMQGMWEDAKSRGIITLSLLSIPTGLFALNDPDSYQLLFLIEHVGIAAIGYMLSKKLALRWGAIGIGLALLYMLSGYTYVLLFLVAVGLIMLAVWRLLKKND